MQTVEGALNLDQGASGVTEVETCPCEDTTYHHTAPDPADELNTPAFETSPTLDDESGPGEEQDPTKKVRSVEERSEEAQGKVRSVFQRIKDAAGSIFGRENVVADAVDAACCWAENLTCKIVDRWIHDHPETEKNDTEVRENPALELIGDILKEAADEGIAEREKAEKRSEDAGAGHKDPLDEMLEMERRMERERTDSPFFIEAFEPLSVEGPSPTGGSYTEIAMEGGDLIEYAYTEDAEGHKVLTGSRILFKAPVERPKVELIS